MANTNNFVLTSWSRCLNNTPEFRYLSGLKDVCQVAPSGNLSVGDYCREVQCRALDDSCYHYRVQLNDIELACLNFYIHDDYEGTCISVAYEHTNA